ncbi:helix-turn-helix domain-containing protein [Amorphus sp. MBR-141]
MMREHSRIVNGGCVNVHDGSMTSGVSGFADRLKRLQGQQSARAFARSIGIAEGTLRTLLGGGRPSLETLVAIAKTEGVRIAWLAAGEGPMRPPQTAEGLRSTVPRLDEELFRQVSAVVSDAHDAEGVRLPSSGLVSETAAAYNELLARAEDPADSDELESLLPWLEARLRKRLRSAREEPGTGKRLA